MDTTEAMLGRRGCECDDESTKVRSTLNHTLKLLAGLSGALETEIDRLQFKQRTEADECRLKEITELVRANQKTQMLVLEIEAKLMREAYREVPGKTVIDLDGARAEIARRLDRLVA